MAASKAELHAVMASLTFKDRDRATATTSALGSAIHNIFQGNTHSPGQDSAKQQSEIQAFLSNPYEAVAVLCE